MKSSLIILAAALLAVPSAGYAQVVETNSLSTTSETAFPVSSSDLVNQGKSSFSSLTSPDYSQFSGAGAISVLNDGTAGTGGDLSTTAFDLAGTYTLVFKLNTTGTSGYNISEIDTFAGWSNAGSLPADARVGQAYTVLYSTVNDPTNFANTLATVSYQPEANSPGGSYSTEVALTSSTSSPIATDVAALEFEIAAPSTYSPGGSASTDVSTIYREFDITGAAIPASVPKPSTWAMMLGGLGIMVRVLHRRNASSV